MDNEFVIRIVNEFTGAILNQAKRFDKDIQKQKAQNQKFLGQQYQLQVIANQKLLALDKEKLSKMKQGSQDYLNLQKSIKARELANAKTNADKLVNTNKARNSKMIANTKASYSKSEDLTKQLQRTLRSVFERAVFYTAIYKGIQLVNQGFQDWIQTNVELDYALAKVNTISKVSLSQMSQLTILSIKTGRSMVDLSNGLYEINSAGILGADAMNVLEVSTRASVAGFVDAQNAADVVTDVLNGYHLASTESEMITSKLLKTVELGKIKWEEYQGVLGRAIPMAYNLGISIDELLGSIATLTLSGVKSREAITGMRGIMTKMLQPTEAMKKALHDMNTELDTSYGSMKDLVKAKGIIPTMQLLGDVISDTDVSTSDLYSRIRALTAQLSLMSDGGEKATNIINQISNSAGTLAEKEAIMANTMVEAQNRLSSAWKSLGIDVFAFGDSMIGVLEIAKELILWLKNFSPMITGLIYGLTALVAVASVVIAKFLLWKTILPLINGQILALATRIPFVTGALYKMGFAVRTASVQMSALNASMGILAVGIVAVVAVYSAMNARYEKNRKEAQAIAEATAEMTKNYKELRAEANLLSQARPFKGMTDDRIAKQITENDRKLEESINLRVKIAKLEKSIENEKDPSSLRAAEDKERLAQAIADLYVIEGYENRNLITMKALVREQDYRNRGLSDEQVILEEISKGFVKMSDEAIKGLSPQRISKITEELNKQKKVLEASPYPTMMTDDGEMSVKSELKRIENLLADFNQASKDKIKEKDKELAEIDEKANKKRLDFLKKYQDSVLKETLDGRIRLIEAERETAQEKADLNQAIANKAKIEQVKATQKLAGEIAEAEGEGYIGQQKARAKYDDKLRRLTEASGEDRAVINKFYDDKILKERETALGKELKLYKTQQGTRFKYVEDFQKKYQAFIKSQKDEEKDVFDERQRIFKEYLNTKAENLQIYLDNELIKIEESNLSKTEKDIASANLTIDLQKQITEAKITEWQKQHEFQVWMYDSISSLAQTSIQSILDAETDGQKTRENIWAATKNLIISSLAEITAKYIKEGLIRLAMYITNKGKEVVTSTTAVAATTASIVAANAIITKSSLAAGAALSLATAGISATTASASFIASLAAMTAAGTALSVGNTLNDAIISNNTVYPYRKDDVVAIGTNMYGTRSGQGSSMNMSGIEAKLDKLIKIAGVGNMILDGKDMTTYVDPLDPSRVNDLNREGEKINRNID